MAQIVPSFSDMEDEMVIPSESTNNLRMLRASLNDSIFGPSSAPNLNLAKRRPTTLIIDQATGEAPPSTPSVIKGGEAHQHTPPRTPEAPARPKNSATRYRRINIQPQATPDEKPEDAVDLMGGVSPDSPFYNIFNQLLKLQTIWEHSHFTPEEMKDKITPLTKSISELVDKESFMRDERKRMATIMEQRQELAELCMRLDEPQEQFENFANANKEGKAPSLSHVQESLRVSLLNLRSEARHRQNQIHTLEKQLVSSLEELGEDVVDLKDIQDLSSSRVQRLSEHVVSLRQLREERIQTVKQLTDEICDLWVEQGYNPVLDTHPTEEQATWCKNVYNFRRLKKSNILGLSIPALNRLVLLKKNLSEQREKTMATRTKLNRRLQLIEARKRILSSISAHTKSHNDPKRLFGNSLMLIDEQKFKRFAYHVLLEIEIRLRAALLDWFEFEGSHFVYEGKNFMSVFESNIKTRKINTDIFPRTRVHGGVSTKFSDLAFVREGGDHYRAAKRHLKEERAQQEEAVAAGEAVSSPIDYDSDESVQELLELIGSGAGKKGKGAKNSRHPTRHGTLPNLPPSPRNANTVLARRMGARKSVSPRGSPRHHRPPPEASQSSTSAPNPDESEDPIPQHPPLSPLPRPLQAIPPGSASPGFSPRERMEGESSEAVGVGAAMATLPKEIRPSLRGQQGIEAAMVAAVLASED